MPEVLVEQREPEWVQAGFYHYSRRNALDGRWDVFEGIGDAGPWKLDTFETEEAAESFIVGWQQAYEQGFHDGYEVRGFDEMK